ncbi:MAG: ABC transporter ATP-binding protein [Alphaproteobacteria bacterium]|nr:ABC transporter ATP-binding protein [Alphaproteobacteria bacterium]
MLRVEGLSVWYGATEVLRNVGFTVPDGEIVALMGGNGAGKSTTLNALSGLLKPRGGAIKLGDRRIDGLHPHDVVMAGIVQVPQGRYVWPSMTVRDNLVLGAVTRRDKAGIARDIEAQLDLFPALRERQKVRAGALSGGQQQMVAIARALMARPKLLLMDEPSHGLSPKIVEEMIDIIRTLHKRGMTILLVEQNVGVAAALAGTAHVLRNGEIALTAPGGELLNNAQLLKSYLGR